MLYRETEKTTNIIAYMDGHVGGHGEAEEGDRPSQAGAREDHRERQHLYCIIWHNAYCFYDYY